ncbi:hypothetical protein JZU69_05290, partial [bacterium]|nr:hypothetical protein [bacterium]
FGMSELESLLCYEDLCRVYLEKMLGAIEKNRNIFVTPLQKLKATENTEKKRTKNENSAKRSP